MSAIARLLLERGHAVSGSDLRDSAGLRQLEAQGARVFVGHAAGHVQGADVVVASSAVPPDNPELAEVRRLSLPLWHRGQMLRCLTGGRRCLAIAGTHGKTTTTAMLVLLLRAAGLDCSFIIGGDLPILGGNGHAGADRRFVLEADEYDHTFLALQPEVAVVTNVEWDHVDCYPDEAAVRQAFAAFIEQVSPEGTVLLCRDDPGAWGLSRPAAPVLGYGLAPGATWGVGDVLLEPQGSTFTVLREGQALGRFRLAQPGRHNVANALAALAVAAEEGLDLAEIGGILESFSGVQRRFQYLGLAQGIRVVDDYAHHPSEVRATLEAARQRFPGRRLVAVFQPHTYSRTRIFAAAFAGALSQADEVLVTGVYAAREIDPGDVSGALVAEQISVPADYVATLDQALSWLLERLCSGDVVLTLGAGDITGLGPRLLSRLRDQEEQVGYGVS
ncbi:MAG: UDP-N-acetylmuramate--L-alanine ligase [Chloroflexia bacterium]|nr:UDP-N-acetylmuramate--L-alanine ligase [Chloroflexia bacterium]